MAMNESLYSCNQTGPKNLIYAPFNLKPLLSREPYSIILVLQPRITDILQILDDLPQPHHKAHMDNDDGNNVRCMRRGAKDGTVPTIVSRQHPNILCSTQDTKAINLIDQKNDVVISDETPPPQLCPNLRFGIAF